MRILNLSITQSLTILSPFLILLLCPEIEAKRIFSKVKINKPLVKHWQDGYMKNDPNLSVWIGKQKILVPTDDDWTRNDTIILVLEEGVNDIVVEYSKIVDSQYQYEVELHEGRNDKLLLYRTKPCVWLEYNLIYQTKEYDGIVWPALGIEYVQEDSINVCYALSYEFYRKYPLFGKFSNLQFKCLLGYIPNKKPQGELFVGLGIGMNDYLLGSVGIALDIEPLNRAAINGRIAYFMPLVEFGNIYSILFKNKENGR